MRALLLILAVAVPAYFINQLLIKIIVPRRSFLRFLMYMAAGFAMAFLYTFIFVWFLLKFF